ncbi:hypothetical protein COT87_02110 [Candidatus Collierbacteria bacterium CG10_big_fil_rev_8_21_14_0_10_44_9]|uniref:Uncharacterized protein n=1 Tax=Candidatus Collierbacteria bacterium CG10_big_fil_rev_8_21_14_0_10_44_9 TaxID=1974535 RepID=A0A2H0VIP5_9BACT|nr:MAG: hypothetical protein COT87_02110 [Candidatus Collierbacteria bacterium CG10_big_fil_rev_8_21_14_0_10_44_9]
MQNLEHTWQEPPNLSLLNAISSATNGIQKYYDTPDHNGFEPTLPWRSAAQLATINWIRETNPDAEDFRTALETIASDGSIFGCSAFEFALVTHYNESQLMNNPLHNQLLVAQETRTTDSRGRRHFGDALVTEPYEQFENISLVDRAMRLAWSNACPRPISYLSRIQSEGLSIPSIPYQPRVVPELSPRFESLDPTLQVFVWDYARCNKLWLAMVDIISRENVSLYHELMHSREELPDSEEAIKSLPFRVNGQRQIRFIALSQSYPVISAIWERFDTHCKDGDYRLAELEFDNDLTRLVDLIPQVSTLAKLQDSFLRQSSL